MKKTKRITAVDLIVGSCGAALSAWEADEQVGHPRDAFELVSLYGHVCRFPERDVPGEVRTRMESVVRRDIHRLADAAMEELKRICATWPGQLQQFLDRLDEGLVGPEEDEARALHLWQQMDDAALVTDVIWHLLDEEDLPEDFSEVFARVEEMGLDAMASTRAFITIRRYIYRLHDAYLEREEMPVWLHESTLLYRDFNDRHRDTIYDHAEQDYRERQQPIIDLSDYRSGHDPVRAAADVGLWDTDVSQHLGRSEPQVLRFVADDDSWEAEITIAPGSTVEDVAIVRVRREGQPVSGHLLVGEIVVELEDGEGTVGLGALKEALESQRPVRVGLRTTGDGVSEDAFEPEGK